MTVAARTPVGRARRLLRRLLSQTPVLVITLSMIAALVTLRAADPPWVRELRALTSDEFQQVDPRAYDPDAPVRIVAIDEASLARLGQWPWSRRLLAELVRKLFSMGAATVAFDVLFAEPDRTSPERVLAELPPGDTRARLSAALATIESHDRVFADALGAAPTVLGVLLEDRNSFAGAHPVTSAKAGFAAAGDDPHAFMPNFAATTAPIPMLAKAAAGLGAINWPASRDQIVREVPLVFGIGDGFYPGLVAEALRVAQGASTIVVRSSNASGQTAFGAHSGINTIRIGDFDIPTTPSGGVLVHFTHTDPRRFTPAWRVLDGSVDPNEFQGRIVLVGATAAGLLDQKSTPLDAVVPGVEIHAQALEQIIGRQHLVRPDWALGIEIVTFFVLAMSFGAAAATLPAWSSLMIGLFALAIVVAGSEQVFVRGRVLLDPSFPGLASLAVLFATTGWVSVREELGRRRIHHAFGRYVAPDLVKELALDPSRLVLGGEMRQMTILFTDVRGFTSLSETMTAQQLTTFINALLTPLTDVILRFRGTIDKYMGDAIMAFWNAPLTDQDHCRHACQAALAMIEALDEFNRSSHGRYPTVAVGIGINTGLCCVGNLGSVHRFDYSVIGDDVNVASRLEGQTKTYHLPIIVGPETARGAPDHSFLPIDRVRVKGRHQPLDLFALVGGPGHPAPADLVALAPGLEAMIAAYRAGAIDAADQHLGELEAAAHPRLAHVLALYRERVDRLRRAPLPAGWEPTVDLLSK